jgi:DNA-binding NarL/FixJ family response regulator
MSAEARARVFVVEDAAPMLKELLKALGTFPELEVVGSAREGEAGVRGALASRPDVLLLDLELPGIDGIEVTRRVKAARPEVEVLILTSFDDEERVFAAMQAGASGYLVKRVGPQKIREGIAEVLRGGTVVEALLARRFWNYFQAVQARPAAPADPWRLEEVELEILRYVAKGLSNAEVGRVLSLERRTVRTHLARLYRKMGVSSHVEAVVRALQAGLVQL